MSAPRAVALAVACAAIAAQAAHADGDAIAEADRLFERAAALAAEGRWDEACPAFARSYEIDPARGSLLGVAQCHEQRGELASAWRTYGRLLDEARAFGDDRRAAIARARREALQPRLPTLTIELEGDIDASELAIRLGQRDLASEDIGAPVPVDPGVYELTVQTPGAEPWSTRLELAEGEAEVVAVPRPSPAPEPAPVPPVTSDMPVDERGRDIPVRYSPGGNRAQRWVGYSAISGGALAAAAGAGFAVRAMVKHRRYRDACPDGACAPGDEEAADLLDDRDDARALATGLVGVGLVVATGGIVLWMTASEASGAGVKHLRVEPLAGPSAFGASVRAAF